MAPYTLIDLLSTRVPNTKKKMNKTISKCKHNKDYYSVNDITNFYLVNYTTNMNNKH